MRARLDDDLNVSIEEDGTLELFRGAHTVTILGAAAVQALAQAIRPDPWVLASQRLPDENVEVQVFCAQKGLFYLASRCDGRWYEESGFHVRGVTHWRDLVPPEGVQA